MTRQEAVSGAFYENDYQALSKQIEACFNGKLGPGDLPIHKRKGFVKALISPHAGYNYSGMCAAWGYKEIAESEASDIYLFIGPNHHSEESSFSYEDWRTPLGIARCERNFVKDLSDAIGVKIDETIHKEEHSIEVQLPFLQFVNKEYQQRFGIACLSLSSDVDIDALSKKLKMFLGKQTKKITLIISSDFTHYGAHYHYIPFSIDKDKKLKELDEGAIDLILSKNAKGFMEYIDKTGATICGYLPIYLLLNVLGPEKGELLMYYTSSEISDDEKNSVSYASIVFR